MRTEVDDDDDDDTHAQRRDTVIKTSIEPIGTPYCPLHSIQTAFVRNDERAV